MLLSHYTSRAGLEGIASSGTLWATSFVHLEDTSEFFYAWQAIQKGAFSLFSELVPSEYLTKDFDLDAAAAVVTQQFKDVVKAADGNGHLYVFSFARSSTEEHEKRGHLTMWHRYTNHQGYCVQYSEEDVQNILQGEGWKGSYGVLTLSNVKYGIDKGEKDYKDLCFQLAQQYVLMALQAGHKLNNLQPDFSKMWPDSYLTQKMSEYCAMHKDPLYEDEREMRIIALPGDKAVARPFTGIAGLKKVHKRPDGKPYIRLGEFWTPPKRPRRIIVGTKANPDISSALSYFEHPPQIALANLPIA